MYTMYTVSQKNSAPSYVVNFVNSWRIFRILTLAHFAENVQQNYHFLRNVPVKTDKVIDVSLLGVILFLRHGVFSIFCATPGMMFIRH